MVQDAVISSGMRKNLLSLRQTAKQSALTSQRITSGKKINSAADNPASFFTASALNARASDLNRLLDSMGQGIQAIKTATGTLDGITTVLDCALSVAMKASETAIVKLDKEWYQEQIGVNGTVVSSLKELNEAIANNKEAIFGAEYGEGLGDKRRLGGRYF